jgi:hypothetical protein
MKKIITLLLFTFTMSLFGQMKEYKKATNLYNDKKFSEANNILEKLINKEYGELEQEMAFYVLYMNAGCYYNLNDFKIAYTKYEELIVFVKNSVNLFTTPSGKEEQIASLEKFKEDFKSKIPKGENTSIQNNISSESNTTTNSVSNEINTKANSDNKTVTLTVSGTGKTIEEARLNALRSAIEQAFGAFISSKTEILNDNLVKDEIVSVTNGNIQKYDVVSQVEIPNNGYALTLNATVSIEKLTTFAESKGVIVEFKGGMFGHNIKLQKLNEKSEIIALKNLCITSFETLLNSVDYSLITSQPSLIGITPGQSDKYYKYLFDFKNGLYVKEYKVDDYKIKVKVTAKSNKNLFLFYQNFKNTIAALSMSDIEISNYQDLNKEIISINFDGDIYKLRSKASADILNIFFAKVNLIPSFFELNSNLDSYNYLLANRVNNFNYIESNFLNNSTLCEYANVRGDYDPASTSIASCENIYPLFEDLFLSFESAINDKKINVYKNGGKTNYCTSLFIYPKEFNYTYEFNLFYTIDDIEKIDKFEIKKMDLLGSLKKEQERLANINKILCYNGYDTLNNLYELNDNKYECKDYCKFKPVSSPGGYVFDLIEKRDDFYIVKAINPYSKSPEKLYKLKPSKEVIKGVYSLDQFNKLNW